MNLSKQTQVWRRRYFLLLTVFLLGLGGWAYLSGFSYFKQREIARIDTEIATQQQEIDRYYQHSGFNQFMVIKKLDEQRTHMPWSDYIQQILFILEKVKSVEEGKGNVLLSDFKVNLEELSLNGVVSNLRVLYDSSRSGEPSLLDSFNDLDFLKEISIRNYERGEDIRGFKFSLSAKVINNDTTKSGNHQ